MNKITVIDCICGSGKTSWAIQFMNKQIDDRFIYITPFLDELTRVIKSSERIFTQPNEKKGKGTKTNHFMNLLKEGDDICSTHSLFKGLKPGVKELIKEQEYILILDEVMDVVEQVPISKRDMSLLLNDKIIMEDENHKVHWIDESYNGEFLKFKYMIQNGDCYISNGSMILWTFPCEIFKAFKEVYILTYMFDGQIQRYYYDINNMEYEYKSIKSISQNVYGLTNYTKSDMSKIKELIDIYNGNLNDIGNESTAFSVSWLNRADGTPKIKRIKDNTYNYFGNILNSKSKDNMFTTFKEYRIKLQGKGYTKGFVEWTARSTNEYKHKTNLAYLCNLYYNPMLKRFFIDKDVTIDEEYWALSCLIQWIFRSAVRDNKPINIYIPSSRMRNLLEKWLNS